MTRNGLRRRDGIRREKIGGREESERKRKRR
jgi:hypothetical protein